MIKPTLADCTQLNATGTYTVIPVSTEVYADNITPIVLLDRLNKAGGPTFLLESVEGGDRWGRYSFLGFDPVKTVEYKNSALDGESESPLDSIRQDLSAYRTPNLPDLPPFTGGYVGFFSYDAIQYFESAVRLSAKDTLDVPDLRLMLFDKVICFDHFAQKIILIVNIRTDDLAAQYHAAENEFARLKGLIQSGDRPSTENPVTGPFESNMTKGAFVERVRRLKAFIEKGDIFQAVLSQRFSAPFRGSLLNVYRVLRTQNPSPYMYFLRFGDIEIAGASPETLVKVTDGIVYACPIAGTRPRGATPEADAALVAALLADEKERAEHNMLVDLARNDIGRVAAFGSVSVSDYMHVKQFSHVTHMASLVTGMLAPGYDSLSAFESVFPAGTLSGAPKIRAMTLLDEMEETRRGIYGGAIGYIDFAGNLDFCIAIRTVVKKEGHIHIGAGAGIVYDSVPENEYEETRHKAEALFRALARAAEDEF